MYEKETIDDDAMNLIILKSVDAIATEDYVELPLYLVKKPGFKGKRVCFKCLREDLKTGKVIEWEGTYCL